MTQGAGNPAYRHVLLVRHLARRFGEHVAGLLLGAATPRLRGSLAAT
jgi:hypothetical protein